MKNIPLVLILLVLATVFACKSVKKEVDMPILDNILVKEFSTPFGVPPFDKITIADYKPAYEYAIQLKKDEIEAIILNAEKPNFANTIEALERSGMLLDKIDYVFQNLLSSNTNEEMEALAEEITPLLSTLNDEILMNEALFQKIKAVHDKPEANMTNEQKTLLEKTFRSFARGGANLNAADKSRLKIINKELGLLSLKFGSNVLKATNNYKLVIDNHADLAGLPAPVVTAAAETASKNGQNGKWVFTLHKSSLIPFITYADNRKLRQELFTAYTMLGNNGDSLDNKDLVKQIVNYRLEKAKLLGFSNYAKFALQESMAKTPERAYDLITNVLTRANLRASTERDELQKLALQMGDKIKIEAWDWWYYAEKLRKEKYNLSEEDLSPYFMLDNVRKGMFEVAHLLYNLNFKENKELPVMDEQAVAYEVSDGDRLIAILYMDYFPRQSKRSGAWMTAYRNQYTDKNGKNVIPIISLTCNFTPATANTPSLLNLDEVTTLFHEFGHGLHGILSECQYESLSGTSVSNDFVELPSQIMENWALEPKVLKSYAKHYQTGEPMPDALIAKLQKASTFNNGFTVSEFVAAAALDMAWHQLDLPFTGDVNVFEKDEMKRVGLIDEIVVRYRSPYYNHIFGGGYAASYYSYLWTAVLDADAYGAFTETSLFDKATANSFRKNILSKGGTEDVEQMWLQFRGREPKIDFYLGRMGL
jgi:peptidyl-dipeptidase Dcp